MAEGALTFSALTTTFLRVSLMRFCPFRDVLVFQVVCVSSARTDKCSKCDCFIEMHSCLHRLWRSLITICKYSLLK